MEYLLLGIIAGSFSLDGTLKIISKTNNAKMRYKKGNKVFLVDKNGNRTEHDVISYRTNGQFDFVRITEIETKEQADSLKGNTLEVIKDVNDLDKGFYYFSDLEGCTIVDENGNNCGLVKIVEEFPAQITLRVSRKGKPDYFIPFIKEFIKEVDINNKTIKVKLIEGML